MKVQRNGRRMEALSGFMEGLVRGCIVAGWERKMCDGRGGRMARRKKNPKAPRGAAACVAGEKRKG
ncbi:hypothetical protein Peur_060619 [Populus x canadensis]